MSNTLVLFFVSLFFYQKSVNLAKKKKCIFSKKVKSYALHFFHHFFTHNADFLHFPFKANGRALPTKQIIDCAWVRKKGERRRELKI